MFSTNHRSYPSLDLSSHAQTVWKQKSSPLPVVLMTVLSLLCSLLGGVVIGVSLVEAHQKLCRSHHHSESPALLCQIVPLPSMTESLETTPMPKKRSMMLLPPAQYQFSATARGLTLAETTRNAEKDAIRDRWMSRLRPLLIEVGVVTIFHALGVGLLNRTTAVVRRIPWMDVWRRIGFLASTTRQATATPLKILGAWYKKTAASKVVTRVKKQVKHIMKHNEKHHANPMHEDD
mmetsp:Transcript_32474/g.67704  ORF Transcript_32474/g.67704 Transcript_32474/m.67704 type:complete len:234 (-) Transcript_32474:259-960(-)